RRAARSRRLSGASLVTSAIDSGPAARPRGAVQAAAMETGPGDLWGSQECNSVTFLSDVKELTVIKARKQSRVGRKLTSSPRDGVRMSAPPPLQFQFSAAAQFLRLKPSKHPHIQAPCYAHDLQMKRREDSPTLEKLSCSSQLGEDTMYVKSQQRGLGDKDELTVMLLAEFVAFMGPLSRAFRQNCSFLQSAIIMKNDVCLGPAVGRIHMELPAPAMNTDKLASVTGGEADGQRIKPHTQPSVSLCSSHMHMQQLVEAVEQSLKALLQCRGHYFLSLFLSVALMSSRTSVLASRAQDLCSSGFNTSAAAYEVITSLTVAHTTTPWLSGINERLTAGVSMST
ncbi:hypothetical protein DNTS_035054, partial [Danionella cerebrum]